MELKASYEKRDLVAILRLLQKYNLKGTEDFLRKEANLKDENEEVSESDLNCVLSAYEGEGNPEIYENAFNELRNSIEQSLDIYKHELATVLYPVIIQIYLKLIYNGHVDRARKILEKFGPEQDVYYQDDIKKLLFVTKRSQMEGNDLISAFENEKFVIRISRDALSILKRHIQDKKLDVISQIVNKHITFDSYEGLTRNKVQCDVVTGSVTGEAKRQDNKGRVYYGMLKEIDFQMLTAAQEEEEELDAGGLDKPKKKRPKKDPLFSKKSKSDPNAPAQDRIPIPDLKDSDKVEKIKALREASKRVTLNKDSLPSACFYTILNSVLGATCAEVCEDSSMIAVGFADSYIKVFSLTPAKLREMKPVEQLKEIDREADDVTVRMMDDRTAESARLLYGHCGPVYRCSFAPDKTLMLSCSEDGTIRLWSFHTWTCLIVYKGHQFPVWDVRFSPFGYYFITSSHDKTARLWATDSYQPLRIFSGHLADVDVVMFHPNTNYVATGSSDRTVRLWDCLTGHSVRVMTGHKNTICSLVFSICGRYLASGGADHNVLIWDLANGQLMAALKGHSGSIHSLCFSRDGNLLATGGLDCCLKIWDFSKLCEDLTTQNGNSSQNAEIKDGEIYLLRSFCTKNSPFLNLHFTRRNLLLAVGMFKS